MIDIGAVKKAIELTQEGKFQEAENLYMELLKENPTESALLSAIGLFYVNLRNYDKAVIYLRKACDIKETIGTVASLGFAECERKNYAQAASILEHALEFGNNIDIFNKLILSLFEIGNFQKAVEYTDKMNELYPNESKSVANKVKALTQTGKLIEAKQLCADYLKKNPEDPILWYHLGLLKELIYSDDIQAIECYKLSGKYGNPTAEYNIGVAYHKLGEYEEAEKHYKTFLNLMPNDNSANVSLGLCYLTQKRFKEGYKLIYNRRNSFANKFTNNLWKPYTELDKELVILPDQGFGDNIQFVRYLPLLKGHNIKVAVSDQLTGLFKHNYPDIEFITKEEINPKTQAIRITDLAYALNLDFDHIPFSQGYLDIEPAKIENKKTKVGLCWEAGSAGVRGMIDRTINVKCFEPLLDLENIQVYSFQYTDTLNGNEKYPQMINLARDFKDFSDTAAALKAMNVVITVDTVIAHLAGALGLKTCLLLPYASDWRWFGGNEPNTPWYDSITIFKQKDHISWEEPIDNIIKSLS